MNIFLGLLGIALGTLMVIKTEWILQNFGKSDWGEQHLSGSGGSRMLYKLIGIGVIIVAMLGMTGMLGPIVLSIFGRLFAPPA